MSLLEKMLLEFMCILDIYAYSGSIVKTLLEIRQASMEMPVMRIFKFMFRSFFSTKSIHQINENSNIFTAETLYKNCIISRQYALDGSFSGGTTNCSRYVDTFTSELEVFNQHSKVNIRSEIYSGVSSSISNSRFTKYDAKSAGGESKKDKNPMKRDSREATSGGQGLSKLVRRLPSTAVAVFPGPLQYRVLKH